MYNKEEYLDKDNNTIGYDVVKNLTKKSSKKKNKNYLKNKSIL